MPAVVLAYFLIKSFAGRKASYIWLLIASLAFYGYWDAMYLPLIMLSITVNYFMAKLLSFRQTTLIFFLACAFNLALLGYYKYANFFVNNINLLFDENHQFVIQQIVLPIGISFFTFQQIAYLVDVYRKTCKPYSFVEYALFVAFFPQLIAGPIVHHNQMMPQFHKEPIHRAFLFFMGICLFTIGLFKKVVIADSLAIVASPIFASAESFELITTNEAWLGILSYSFQLYFDFSGYTDMAMGIALLFGIKLPVNFLSPYKSTSIIDFWRRWHITLSEFLRDYLYIPLGGSRLGKLKRMRNLFLTMFLGGIWHGAGWGFVVWGSLHGGYLIMNHLFRSAITRFGLIRMSAIFKPAYWLLTFMLVCIAWTYFRAPTVAGANHLLFSAFQLSELSATGIYNTLSFPDLSYVFSTILSPITISFTPWTKVCIAFAIAIFLPNTYQFTCWAENNLINGEIFRHIYLIILALSCGIALAFITLVISGSPSEFIYFQF